MTKKLIIAICHVIFDGIKKLSKLMVLAVPEELSLEISIYI